MQGTAPITGLIGNLSDSEDTEIESHESTDSSRTEKLFLTGVLDELKISFSYSGLVRDSLRSSVMWVYITAKSLNMSPVCTFLE